MGELEEEVGKFGAAAQAAEDQAVQLMQQVMNAVGCSRMQSNALAALRVVSGQGMPRAVGIQMTGASRSQHLTLGMLSNCLHLTAGARGACC